MTNDTQEKSEIAREILAYLSEHPDAQDTLEGIVEWWLLEQKIEYQTAMVKKALADLVEKGLVLEQRERNSGPFYKMNKDKVQDGNRPFGLDKV